MMKHFTSLLGSICLSLLTVLPASGQNVVMSNVQVDDLYYQLYDDATAEVLQSKNNRSLTSVDIPEKISVDGSEYTVTSIGDYAFMYCSRLTSITIPNSVKTIGIRAFNSCSNLTSFTFPNSVTSIGDYAFLYCSGLTSITIPNSVTSIGERSFSQCTGLTNITIPNSVTSIGYCAFKGCSSLLAVEVDDLNTTYSSIDGVLFNKDITNIIYYPTGKTDESYSIPNSVTSIGDYAFCGCSSLTSITIPNSVTSIGEYAFSFCYVLTSIAIPNSVTSISDYAFWGCYILTSITIPNSVTSLGYNAVSFCGSLTSITCEAAIPPVTNSTFDSDHYTTATLYVPAASVDAYKTSEYDWSKFTNIQPLSGYTHIELTGADNDTPQPATIYTLGGQHTDGAQPGIYIIRQGGKSRKAWLR